MMYLTRTLKQFAFLLLPLFIGIFSCKKQKPIEDPPDPPTETPNVYESILTLPAVSFCGSALISNLKIKDGTDIGTVTVGNDAFYLYLTYNLTGNWYMGDAHSYAGRESLIPRNTDGNPVYGQFPGKQHLNFCDLRQAFTFRVLLSALSKDNNTQCPTNEQYYIAMRAAVRQFSNSGDCIAGIESPAWLGSFLMCACTAERCRTALYDCRRVGRIAMVCASSSVYC